MADTLPVAPPNKDAGRAARALLSPVSGAPTPHAPDEPELDIYEIQGNSLAGFNKDYQTFLFIRIADVEGARTWLRALVPTVSTLAEVLAFNRLFRAMRARMGADPVGLSATWLNIAFASPGIAALTSDATAAELDEPSFQAGMHNEAGELGDSLDTTAWKVGGTDDTVAHILLIVASDQPASHRQAVQRLRKSILSARSASGKFALEMILEQAGATLPGKLRGHEHFGFKDGISQPGPRGRVSSAPQDFLTPRWIDPADPRAVRFGRPGQPLVWPGQFVLGYARQNDQDALLPKEAEDPDNPLPLWAHNGSFVVVRRLRQDVDGFHAFVQQQAMQLAQTPDFQGISPTRLASMMVGRWPSGTPILRAPDQDIPALALDEFANNNFRFQTPTPPVSLVPIPDYAGDTFPQAQGDTQGSVCPFAGHIRKVNPRDDPTDQSGPNDTLTRLLLRRGIPYGKVRDADRGLMFVSYQTSMRSQFHFMLNNWVDDVDRPVSTAGFDAIIGQKAVTDAAVTPTDRSREIILRNKTGQPVPFTIPKDYIVMTGGGYFFSPSIRTLKSWAVSA